MNKKTRLYQIGEFSRITQISIKALRHYQELGILQPSHIDEKSAYRYYNEKLLDRAREIQNLRSLKFSLKEIADIFKDRSEDDDLLELIQKKSRLIENQIEQLQNVHSQLNIILSNNKKTKKIKTIEADLEIDLIDIPDQHIASIRFKGRHSDVGLYFKRIFKAVGFKAQGKPANLYFDEGYKEIADIECYLPIKKFIHNNDVSCRTLKGGKAYRLNHIGSYATLYQSYKRIFDYFSENNIAVATVSREIYHKGPGMIFKGNPDKYITEIQFFAMPEVIE